MSRLIAPVAVVLSRFPTVTETFILREMIELDRLGVPVVPWPLLRERAAPVHEEAAPWMPRALFTPFLDPELALALVRAFLTSPGRSLAAFARALWISRGGVNALAGTLGILAKCVWAGRRLRERGVRHVHAHFATHPAMAAWLASRLGDSPLPWSVTVHAHDIFVSHAGLREKLSEAAFVRCISEFNSTYLRGLFGEGEEERARYPVIHCGIETERYGRTPREGRALEDRSAELLCIASHRPYKGLTHLIEAMRLIAERGLDLHLTVLGDGPLRPRLEAQIRDADLDARIDLAGNCSQAEVARRLASCDLFVLPSIIASDGQMEGIPVALMEAMASEVPVVTTRLSGIPELVRDGVTGLLVEPADPIALAQAIERSLRDPESAAERTRAGRLLVEQEYEIGATCERLLGALTSHGADWSGPEDVASLAHEAVQLSEPETPPRIGIVSWSRSRDAVTVQLALPAREGAAARRLVAKRHGDREGATSSARQRAEREHRALQALHREGLPVPAPQGLDGPAALVLMEAIEGEGLDALLARARRAGRLDDDTEGALRASVRLWGALEHCEGPARSAQEFGVPSVTARLQRELQEDAAAAVTRGLSAALVQELVSEATTRLAETESPSCWTHGDAWSGNLVLTPAGPQQRLVLLDLEGLRPGRASEDLANFLEHLALSEQSPWPSARRGARSAIELVLAEVSSEAPDRGLRIAKALRIAAWSPALAAGCRRALRRHRRRLRALLAERPS